MCNMCCIWNLCFLIRPSSDCKLWWHNLWRCICNTCYLLFVIWFVLSLSSVKWKWTSMSSGQIYWSSDCLFLPSIHSYLCHQNTINSVFSCMSSREICHNHFRQKSCNILLFSTKREVICIEVYDFTNFYDDEINQTYQH